MMVRLYQLGEKLHWRHLILYSKADEYVQKNLIRVFSNLFGFGKSFNNLENLSVFSNHTPHKNNKIKTVIIYSLSYIKKYADSLSDLKDW